MAQHWLTETSNQIEIEIAVCSLFARKRLQWGMTELCSYNHQLTNMRSHSFDNKNRGQKSMVRRGWHAQMSSCLCKQGGQPWTASLSSRKTGWGWLHMAGTRHGDRYLAHGM